MDNLIFIETAGFSMWPFLKAGERLIIKKTPREDLRLGDIILYRTENQLACHRLLRKIKRRGGYMLYVRGDNSRSSPEGIFEQMYLGKVIGALRHDTIVTFTSEKQQLINRVIVLIAPLVSWINRIMKPCYIKIRKIKFKYSK